MFATQIVNPYLYTVFLKHFKQQIFPLVHFLYCIKNKFLTHLAERLALCAASGNVVEYVNYSNESLTNTSHFSQDIATHAMAFFWRGTILP